MTSKGACHIERGNTSMVWVMERVETTRTEDGSFYGKVLNGEMSRLFIGLRL